MFTQSADVSALGNRGIAFFAVVALHLAAVYAFYSGLMIRVAVHMPAVFRLISTPPPAARPRPPVSLPEPVLKPSMPFVPMPENPPVAAEESNHIEAVSPTLAPVSPPVTTPVHTFTTASFDPQHPFKVGEDYYPPGAVRLGQEGRCSVQLTIAAEGKITAATLASSTGFALLDEACLTAVRGQRMRPALRDGKPVESRAVVPIVWKLKSRP